MVTVRSRARTRNRPRPTLAWLILAIAAALIALSVRVAAGAPKEPDDWLDELDSSELDSTELDSGELDDREIDELIVETADDVIDELSEDQLEALGFDADAIERGWVTSEGSPARTVRSRSPIGRVDLSLVYRRIDPIASERRDELLILGTWRR